MLSKAAMLDIIPATQQEQEEAQFKHIRSRLQSSSTYTAPLSSGCFRSVLRHAVPQQQRLPNQRGKPATTNSSASREAHAAIELVPCILSFLRLMDSGGGVMLVDWCIRGTGKC
jgi:hypothetical protein